MAVTAFEAAGSQAPDAPMEAAPVVAPSADDPAADAPDPAEVRALGAMKSYNYSQERLLDALCSKWVGTKNVPEGL